MRAKLCWALLFLPQWAAAFGGSPLRWQGGTYPWDTVPAMELDVEARSAFGSGRGALGLGLSAGLLDQIQLAGQWDQALDGQASMGEASLVAREESVPAWRPALGAYVRSHFGGLSAEARPGLIVAIEPWDHSLALNVEGGSSGLGLRLAYWSPYLTSFWRAGMEAQWRKDAWVYVPQCVLNLPGDVSLGLAGRQEGGSWSGLFHLSYILFPSP